MLCVAFCNKKNDIPEPGVSTVYIEDIEVPEQVPASENNFTIRLIGNSYRSDIACKEIRYESTVTETSLTLKVKGYHHPNSDGTFGCHGAVTPFGERDYTVEANPRFVMGRFNITLRNPRDENNIQKSVNIVE